VERDKGYAQLTAALFWNLSTSSRLDRIRWCGTISEQKAKKDGSSFGSHPGEGRSTSWEPDNSARAVAESDLTKE
jgi:hypothetical protein